MAAVVVGHAHEPLERMMSSHVKEVERSVLETFKAEIPSKYFSDKTEHEYEAYKANATYLYRNLLKFPPQMFKGCSLIDFGAGTGENTVYLANWGARCTLVEMNDSAQDISKEVFRKYSGNYDEHRFFLSSIFDYESPDTYDVVHCRGVLSHTANKEGAFSKIASFLKPGGYLIFGDPNKAGGFQNMVQRYIIYKFATTWDEMVAVSELLFKDDIDRSQSFVNRTRRAIIFDRWVVQSQNDPSVGEVLRWFYGNDLVLYSSHPPVVLPVFGDSAHHTPKFEPQSFNDVGVLTEAVWLMQNASDREEVPKILRPLMALSEKQFALVDYVSNCNLDSAIESDGVKDRIGDYLDAWNGVHLTAHLATRMTALMKEAKEVLDRVETGNLDEVRQYIAGAKQLFRGAVGVRHVDFIAYKNS
jgi:2-polyprenyl-3-methyl-5-hydroxy-6-metoxy-1,4-benzoquinol methylase